MVIAGLAESNNSPEGAGVAPVTRESLQAAGVRPRAARRRGRGPVAGDQGPGLRARVGHRRSRRGCSGLSLVGSEAEVGRVAEGDVVAGGDRPPVAQGRPRVRGVAEGQCPEEAGRVPAGQGAVARGAGSAWLAACPRQERARGPSGRGSWTGSSSPNRLGAGGDRQRAGPARARPRPGCGQPLRRARDAVADRPLRADPRARHRRHGLRLCRP